MKRLLYSILLVSASCNFALAQSVNIGAVMRSVANNNKQLKAMAQSNSATIMEMKADNTLGATSVEYSPFFRSGAGGIASSELIVSQEFKLPTAYATQNKSIALSKDALNKDYDLALRNILVEAQNLCYDLQTAIQTTSLIKGRIGAADSLMIICRKRILHGETTVMELNRVKIDSMTLQSELMKNQSDITQLKIALLKLGASEESLKTDGTTPSANEAAPVIPHSAELARANAVLQQAQQETAAARSEWLPTLTLGYRRNTELHEASNGPLVGVSIPLFSNSRKIKASRLRQSAAQLEVESAQQRLDAQRQALQAEAQALQQQLAAYDTKLMDQSLKTLMRAVNAGELSIAEYYVESTKIYSILQNKLTSENRYNKVQAELRTF